MLTKELNRLLTRVGPGTPMGEVFRRFWLPALVSSEVATPDSLPIRLRILGEDLVAFRDTAGRVGIVSAFCSHRLAPLFFGRNEECGLRCPYHGWKFDVTGACVDMPNMTEQNAAKMKARAAIQAYPAREAGGIVWVYMGPKEMEPPLPGFEWLSLPPEQVHVSRWLQRSNYSVGMEGEIDSAHISFLHKEFKQQDGRLGAIGHGRTDDGAPRLTLRDTDYGFMFGAERKYGEQSIWRMTHWFAPMFSLVALAPGEYREACGRAWVPVDDNHTTSFSYWYRVDGPLGDTRPYLDSGAAFPPRMTPVRFALPEGMVIDTFMPVANKENDYLVDRKIQRTETFTGIWGANDQDRALQESMLSVGGDHPGVVDRSREHLMASDIAVVAARTKLIKMAQDLKQGIEPSYPRNGAAWAVRAISKICSIDDFDEFTATFAGDIAAPPARAPGRSNALEPALSS